MVSDIMVALEIACRQRGDVRLLIDDEFPLPGNTRSAGEPFRWKVRATGGKSVGVIPDKVFALETQDRTGSKNERILFCLEADRGTMPVIRSSPTSSSFASKLRAYADSWRQGIHRQRFGCSRFRVLAVTTSKDRVQNFQQAAAALHHGSGLFLFASIFELGSGESLITLLTAQDGAKAS